MIMATTTTTTCDKCGQECVYGMVRIQATTVHWTGQREHVGEDYNEPAELCMTCGRLAADVLGLKVCEEPERIQQDTVQPMLAMTPPLEHVREMRHGWQMSESPVRGR
jgi:hypothetical protein